MPEEQLNTMLALGVRRTADDTANACPVCRHNVVGLKPYVKHVGRHLEQLMLFALPPVEGDNEDDEGDQKSDDEGNGSRSQSPTTDLVVSHDAEGNEYMVPMGFNLSHDLGDFLTWHAEQAGLGPAEGNRIDSGLPHDHLSSSHTLTNNNTPVCPPTSREICTWYLGA